MVQSNGASSRNSHGAAVATTAPLEPINIAFGVDAEFVPHIAAAIASIVRNARGAQFRFLIIHDAVSDELRASVETVAPSARFDWIRITDGDIPPFARKSHFSRAILFRLGLPALAPSDCSRVLYLDTDVIALGDVRDLWSIDLKGASLGAVIDVLVNAETFGAHWQLPAPTLPYFNSGVLLIDLDRIRAEKSFSKAIEFIVAHNDELPFPDQDALNHEFWNRWHPLDLIWNVQRDVAYTEKAKYLPEDRSLNGRSPALVHFTSEVKPWTPERYHPWAWIYWDNLSRTPFLHEVAAKSGVSPFKRFRLWLRWMRRRPRPNWG